MMTVAAYQVCTRCVMDTTDPDITFDDQGICHHCHEFDQITAKRWFPNAQGESQMQNTFTRIKAEGANQEYDSIIGLSGGIDSSYLAVMLKDRGLRPLVMHVDGGWNNLDSTFKCNTW
ncbi:hypothetical protein AXE65_06555 [Ventosimonas gracilis]|uniref:NAD/GMP synthase domain-containing protein n=1 Tax=Ventosimonas gracilis TaxID=1680762 RepID=A0A139SKB1_9GAMM|nr:hypothetical protein [Ventosimonas gracilis]KXU34991.1 hypothetical protein AXE65_06555 [Ventosimonas gracilis]